MNADNDVNLFQTPQGIDVSFKVRALADQLLCSICGGFYRNASTIKDCLHTFCRTCILRHLIQRRSACPKCQMSVEGNLIESINEDERMQHLVDKLLPYFECQESRMKKRFLRFLGLGVDDKSMVLYQKGGGSVTCEMEPLSKATTNEIMGALKASRSVVMLHLMPDSQCSIAQQATRLKCPHMMVSGELPVGLLSAFIAAQLEVHVQTFVVDVYLGEDCLQKERSIEWVCRSRRLKVGPSAPPVCITYRVVQPRVMGAGGMGNGAGQQTRYHVLIKYK